MKKLFFSLILLCFSQYCLADISGISNQGILNDAFNRFDNAITGIDVKLRQYASYLFYSLLTISLVINFGRKAFSGNFDKGHFFGSVVIFIFFSGVWIYFLNNTASLAGDVINSFNIMASEVNGIGSQLSPSGVIDVGFAAFYQISVASEDWGWKAWVEGKILGAAILVLMSILAIDFLCILVAAWIMSYAGVIFLAFAGLDITRDIALNYIRTIIAIGLKIFGLILIIGIGMAMVIEYIPLISANENTTTQGLLVEMFVVVLLLFILSKRIPDMLAGVIGHTGANGMWSGTGSAGFMGGIATMAAAMTVASNAMSGAASTLGGMAGAGGAQLGGALSAGSASMGDPFSGSAAKIGSAFTNNVETLAASRNPIVSMAGGIMSYGGSKVGDVASSISESVSKTSGGQIGEAIRTAKENSGYISKGDKA